MTSNAATAPANQRLRELLGVVALAALVTIAVLVALAGADGPSFLVRVGPAQWTGWLAGPLGTIGDVVDPGAFVVLVVAAWGCYLAAIATAMTLRPRVLLGAIGVLHLVFALAPPLLSGDIFSYVAYGRIGALHGIDPYVQPPLAAHGDPVLVYVAHAWRTVLSAYGPLFTLLTYLLAPLGVAAAVWSLKGIAALASLAIVAIVWRLAAARGVDPRRAAVIFGLNPVLLIDAVGGAHNDLLMLALTMGAVLLLVDGRERSGGALLVVSAAVKASSVVLLPFAVIGARRPRSALAGAVAAAGAVAVVAVIAFGDHAAGFAGVLEHGQAFNSRSSVPVTIDLLLGGGGAVPAWARTLSHVLLAAALGLLLVRTLRGADWLLAGAWAFVAVAATATYLLPWYTIWALPLAAVSSSRRLLAAVVALQGLFLAHAIGTALG